MQTSSFVMQTSSFECKIAFQWRAVLDSTIPRHNAIPRHCWHAIRRRSSRVEYPNLYFKWWISHQRWWILYFKWWISEGESITGEAAAAAGRSRSVSAQTRCRQRCRLYSWPWKHAGCSLVYVSVSCWSRVNIDMLLPFTPLPAQGDEQQVR